MTENSKYRKKVKKVYEQFRRDEISVDEIDFPMLLKINRMLDEELAERIQIMEEIYKLELEDTKSREEKRRILAELAKILEQEII